MSGGGGLSGVTGFASGIPASLMGSLRGGGGGAARGGESGAWMFGGMAEAAGRRCGRCGTPRRSWAARMCGARRGHERTTARDWSWTPTLTRGLRLPRMTYDMIRVGTTVDRADVRAGDLVFSNFSGRRPEHVQLAVSSTKVIEAPTPGGHVQYSGFPHGRVVVKRIVG